jgi:hypothetical protein
MMPGESRTIRTEVNQADTRDERPQVRVEGYNMKVAAVH